MLLAHHSYPTITDGCVERLCQVRDLLSRACFKQRTYGLVIVCLLKLGFALLQLHQGDGEGDAR